MALTARISAFIEALTGTTINITRSASVTDGTFTAVDHNPLDLNIVALANPPFGTTVDLDMTTAQYLFLEVVQPTVGPDPGLDVTITTPTGVVPTPTTVTLRVNNILLISSQITSLQIFNPNNIDIAVRITAIGV